MIEEEDIDDERDITKDATKSKAMDLAKNFSLED